MTTERCGYCDGAGCTMCGFKDWHPNQVPPAPPPDPQSSTKFLLQQNQELREQRAALTENCERLEQLMEMHKESEYKWRDTAAKLSEERDAARARVEELERELAMAKHERDSISRDFEILSKAGESGDNYWLKRIQDHKKEAEALRGQVKYWEEQCEQAREALEFYADKFTWRSNSGKIGIQPIYHSVEQGGDCEMIDGQFTAGYRARTALATQAPDAKLINTEISLEKPTPSIAASLSKAEFDRLTGPKRELPAAQVEALEAVAKAAQAFNEPRWLWDKDWHKEKDAQQLYHALSKLRWSGWRSG